MKKWFSLTPLAVFLLFYLVISVIAKDFYIVPITVAFVLTSIYAICITQSLPLEKRIKQFSQGAAKPDIMLMIWIFILAGAFAQSAKVMGAVDATVGLTLKLLPDSMLLPGLFFATCFVSLSIGTSVGTVVALTPMAVGIAEQTELSIPFVVGIVVGGAFFGDNLSFISDTTIVATRTQHCKMSDKFKVNVRIVTPAALLVLLYYFFRGMNIEASASSADFHWLKVIPYLIVLITAASGVNVLIVLSIGILFSGLIGICLDSFDFFGWLAALSEGIMGMSELIIVTLLAGGVLELIRIGGGIDFIVHSLTRRVNGKRGAEFTIALLVVFTNFCTANNTVALMTVGSIANNIAKRFGIDNRRSASILDTSSCFAQSIIPYGAQLLIAAGLASISPVSIIPHLCYPFVMTLFVVLCIVFRYPRKYAR